MKRILFVLLLVPAFCFAQNKKALSHFWDIPWGTSMEAAEAIFLERGFEASRQEGSLMIQAKYEREDAFIILLFNNAGRLYCGNVIYQAAGNDAVIPKYENYREVLFRRYGMPDTAVEYFVEPYEKGDGREIEALGTENAFYFTEWVFQDKCLASVSILKNLNVCLSFENPVYTDTAVGRR